MDSGVGEAQLHVGILDHETDGVAANGLLMVVENIRLVGGDVPSVC